MNRQLKEMFDRSEGRYFTELEEKQLLGYASGLTERLDMMDAIAEAEESVLDDVCAQLDKRFPEIPEEHGESGHAKVRRDLGLVLRYAALSMVFRDPDFIHDKLACWLRTVLFALSNRERVTIAFELLADAAHRHLAEDTAKEIAPHLEVITHEFRGCLKARDSQEAA